MMNRLVFLTFSLLFIIMILPNKAEFPYCICQGCQRNQTIGRLFEDTCYFIPVGFNVDPRNISTKFNSKYPLLLYNKTNVHDTEWMKQLVLQMTADYYLLFGQNHIILRVTVEPEFQLQNMTCPILDIAQHHIRNDCIDKQHAIFVASDYERQEKDYYNESVSDEKLKDCTAGRGYKIQDENRCFFYREHGSCPNDRVLNVNTSAAYESLKHFMLVELNTKKRSKDNNSSETIVQPKTITELNVQFVPENVSTNNARDLYFVRTPETSTVPRCYKVNSLTRRMTKLTNSKCIDESSPQPVLCEMFLNDPMNENAKTYITFSKNILFVFIGFSLLFVATIIGLSVTCYFRWKAHREGFTDNSNRNDIAFHM